MGRLNNNEFVQKVGDLLTENNGKSSVYLTQKRLSPALDLEESTEVTESQQFPILIRISMNSSDEKNKVKLSTVVETENLDQFWSDYSQAIKSGFIGLKKKDKKKSKKKVTK